MNNKILVTDIETTNFLNQGGSIVEIAIVELDLDNGNIKVLLDTLCREKMLTAKHRKDPFGWIFKNSDLKIEDVRNASSFDSIKQKVQEIINTYQNGITAFNRIFDISFLQDRGIIFPKLQPCPMIVLTNIIQLPGKFGSYKWPKVEEAYKFLFPNEEYIEKHRGADDAVHEAKIIYEMFLKGWYVID